MANSISNIDDIIDSRDVIARIEELEETNVCENCGRTGNADATAHEDGNPRCDGGDANSDEAIVDDATELDDCPLCNGNSEPEAHDEGCVGKTYKLRSSDKWERNTLFDDDDQEELTALKKLADKCEGYGSDWKYGATLINEDYFAEYAEELASDITDYDSRNVQWPFTCIDWEKAAEELKQDYTAVEFDGQTFYVR